MDIGQAIGRKEPEIVFHYTTSEGFLGITDSKCIWATNIHYLNDYKEFNHSFELFKNELYQRKAKQPEKSNIFDFLANSFTNIRDLKIFVCSFTEEGDLLSQWRGYCPNGGGITLGFDFQLIKKSANSQGYLMGPILYEDSEKRAIVKMILDSVLPWIESSFNIKPENEIRGYFYQQAILAAPFMKHASFKEEKEWRCALLPSTEQIKQIKHRAIKSLIIPFHEFNIRDESDFSINRIIIGPSESQRLLKNAVSDILYVKGIKWSQLSCSAIPYRILQNN